MKERKTSLLKAIFIREKMKLVYDHINIKEMINHLILDILPDNTGHFISCNAVKKKTRQKQDKDWSNPKA